MTAAMRITLLAVAAMAVLSTVSAVTYNVGEPGAWDLQTNYATWAASKSFVVGDSIVFTYSPTAHDVLEVSKADYDSCNAASPITTFQTGKDTIPLPAAGTRYFICGFSGHCTTTGGMKVQIDVKAGSSPSPPAPASGPSASNSPPAPASVPGAGNSPPTPKTPSAATTVRATAGLGLVVLLAGLMA